mgnify:CR=1 FL=1
MNENVGSSSINYTINAISASANLLASQHVYPTRVDKPSNIIKEVIRTDKAIKESFPLMTEAFISQNHLIPSDDMTVKISGMQDVDAITYINKLSNELIADIDVKCKEKKMKKGAKLKPKQEKKCC